MLSANSIDLQQKMDIFLSRSKSYQLSSNKKSLQTKNPNRASIIQQLKLQCAHLLQDDNKFQAMHPQRKHTEQNSTTSSQPPPLRTYLRSITRQKETQQKHTRMASCELEQRQQTKYSSKSINLTSTFAEMMANGRNNKITSLAEGKMKSMNKKKENIPILYRKGSMYFKSEPLKHRPKYLSKKPQHHGFERIVRELKAILMKQ